jgi:AraC-like DNA-binding protein
VDGVRTGAGLAAVAACSGFADQAHLCREIKDLTGVTPTGLLDAIGAREEGASPVAG